jgi:hypothetical protein
VFERFAASFTLSPAGQEAGRPWDEGRLSACAGYDELAARFAGCTFEDGLYRIHDAASGPKGMELLADAFPEFAARSCPFAYDWLGRQFAVDGDREEAGEALVLLMEPGTGQALEIPFDLVAFHEQLDDLREPALAQAFFLEWSEASGATPLKPEDCVGYKVPLFLGGSDTVDNLEVVDMDVYWTLSGQLLEGVRG